MKTHEPILDDAINTLLTTRDFCGNEAEALRGWEADYRKLTPEERIYVMMETTRQWNVFHKQSK